MSDGFAVAGVSAVLRRRLLDAFSSAGVASAVGTPSVTVEPPDRVVDSAEPTGVNLYLHRATTNPGWRGVGEPTRRSSGGVVGSQPLALDLHYLLTAYGSAPYHAEVLLGQAMLALHQTGVLGPDEVDRALAGGTPPADPDLPDAVRSSRLAQQVEHLRVSQEPMDVETAARLWSALQTPYRMSAAYVVTVVLLEPTVAPTSALPVASVGSAVLPLRRPRVTGVVDAADPAAPIVAGATIAVLGERLLGAGDTRVQVDDQVVVPAGAAVTDRRVELPLASLPTPLRAGGHTLAVVHGVDLGDPPVAHDVLRSSSVAFQLRPTATATAATTGTAVVDGVERGDGTLTVTLDPPVGQAAEVLVLLDHLASGEAAALQVPAGNGVGDPAGETTTVTVAYAGVRTGAHLVRAVVDGAESPVSGSPYDQPQVTL